MKYVCQICGYEYDDDKEAVPFDQLPDDWRCPLCRAPKSEFKPKEDKSEKPAASRLVGNTINADHEMTKLSLGQLAALCGNFARAEEKQYNTRASTLFARLERYFASVVPEVPDSDVEKLAAMLRKDIDLYPELRAVADRNSDRGAARAIVWGEKVTRMLSSLVDRYLSEGEALLAETEVWVCTACGFIYIGQEPPAQCPVCKVPDWKFEKIDRRVRT